MQRDLAFVCEEKSECRGSHQHESIHCCENGERTRRSKLLLVILYVCTEGSEDECPNRTESAHDAMRSGKSLSYPIGKSLLRPSGGEAEPDLAITFEAKLTESKKSSRALTRINTKEKKNAEGSSQL
jgi:hypothetical protein